MSKELIKPGTDNKPAGTYKEVGPRGGAVSDPAIYNNTTGQTFGLDIDLVSGDVVTIDTRRGSLRATLNHGGTVTNIINAMTNGSEWIKLRPGNNSIRYNASSGGASLTCSVAFTPICEGL